MRDFFYAVLGCGLGKNAWIMNVFAFKNMAPIFAANLSINLIMKGFRMTTRATVNRIRKMPYASALRMYKEAVTRRKIGHNKVKGMAAGW